jgi:hypothetical protein
VDSWERVIVNLIARLDGPMHFRLFLQPATALFFGIRDGLKDAREGKPAYFWAMFAHPAQARELLESGFKSVTRVVIFALIMDAIYQLIVSHWFYPGEALLVAFILAFVPYLLIRGPVNRVARMFPGFAPSPLVPGAKTRL